MVTTEHPETTVVADLPVPMPLPTMFSCPFHLSAHAKVCPVPEDPKDRRDPTDLPETKDDPAPTDAPDPLDLKDPEAHLASLETVDLEDLLAPPETSDPLDPPRPDLLALLVVQDLLALPDVPDLPETMVNPADKDRPEMEAHVVSPALLDKPAAPALPDNQGHQAHATIARQPVSHRVIRPTMGSSVRIVSSIAFLGLNWLQQKQQRTWL